MMSHVLPTDFNPSTYRNLYPDLSALSDEECAQHYLNHGISEGRVYKISAVPSQFNSFVYGSLYTDLYRMCTAELTRHYSLYGHDEDRCYSIQKFFEMYPYYNGTLYQEYLGIDLPSYRCILLFNSRPVFLEKHGDVLYHVDVKFFQRYSGLADSELINYIKEHHVEISSSRMCCHKCLYIVPSALAIYNLCSRNTVQLNEFQEIKSIRTTNNFYELVIILNVGKCSVECINDILTYINRVIAARTLLVMTYNTHVSKEVIDILIRYKESIPEYVFIQNDSRGFDIGQFILTAARLKELDIRYNFMIRLHTKTDRKWRNEMIIPIMKDVITLRRMVELMITNNIHYIGGIEHIEPLDCNCYELIGKLFPGIYHKEGVWFIAGTIFVATEKYVNKFLEVVPSSLIHVMTDKYTTNKNYHEMSFPHAIERMFGIINYLHFTKESLVIVSANLTSKLSCDVLVNNVQMMVRSGYTEFVIIFDKLSRNYAGDAIEKLKNVRARIDFLHDCSNTSLDIGKWGHFMSNCRVEYMNFKRYVFTNNSYILTRPIPEFATTDDTYSLYAIVDCNTPEYHYQTFLFTICNLINFSSITRNVDEIKNVDDVVRREIDLYHKFKLHKTGCMVNSTQMGIDSDIFQTIQPYSQLLTDDTLPVIKLKSLFTTTYDSDTLPSDFDPRIYRELHSDLSYLTDDAATTHFLVHGMKEGRRYRHDQESKTPPYILAKLREIQFPL